MEKLVLEYLGEDFLGTPVYKDKEGNLLKDINCDRGGLDLYTVSGDIDGDPNMSISRVKKYQGLEIVILGRDNEPTRDEKFRYQMLSRLKMDCDYFLGYGNRYEKHLWANNVTGQILKMKELHSSFSDDMKPEWLTLEEILNYEALMTTQKTAQ